MKRLSVVAVMSTSDSTGLGASLVRALQQLGLHAELIPEPHPRSTWMTRALLDLGRHAPGVLVSEDATREALSRLSPDLTIVVKGSFVNRRLISDIRSTSVAVCWNPDSPFDAAVSNRGGRVAETLDAYDLYVTWSNSIGRSLEDFGANVAVIPFGFDPELHHRVEGGGDATGRVVFVGTASAGRVSVLRRLSAVEPLVYGSGWAPGPYEVRPPVYGLELSAVTSSAKWCLNLLRPQNRDSHNMRSFELPACGARQLTMATEDHVKYLAGTGASLAEDIGHLVELAQSDPSGDEISIGANHTYVDRIERLLGRLKSHGLSL